MLQQNSICHIGVSIADGDLGNLTAAELGRVARRVDNAFDYWVIGEQRSAPASDPTVTAAAAIRHTAATGIVVAASVHRDHPYNLARRLVSLGHASRGRTGWLARDADPITALGATDDAWLHQPVGEQLTRSAIGAVRALFNGWPLNTIVADKDRRIFADTTKILAADVDDAYRIAGPLPLPAPAEAALPILGRHSSLIAAESPDVLVREHPEPSATEVPQVFAPAPNVLSLPESVVADGVLLRITLDQLNAAAILAGELRGARPTTNGRRSLRHILGLPAPGVYAHSGRAPFAAAAAVR